MHRVLLTCWLPVDYWLGALSCLPGAIAQLWSWEEAEVFGCDVLSFKVSSQLEGCGYHIYG